MDYINKILCGNDLEILPKLPAESVNCVTCSPPYWGLRDYGVEPVIWDGVEGCEHEWVEGKSAGDIRFRPGHNTSVGNNKNPDIWIRPSRTEFANRTVDEICPVCNEKFEGKPGQKFCSIKCLNTLSNAERTAQGGLSNFCIKCGAWRGSLGLEPTFELYIKHLCDIFDEVKRVLRKDGTCFVNIGDSYGGSGNASGHKEDTRNLGYKTLEMGATRGNQGTTGQYAKSLLDIPYRFSIEMINRGWIKRNTIIWWKPNCMPSSAPDRFTIDFEYLFFFTKNNKALFWTNEKTLECVSKKPLGIKGIEGKDWEWRKCTTCQGTGQIVGKALKDGIEAIEFDIGVITKNTKTFKVCPRCEGSGKIKYSFWTSHDYWFEQQFDKYDYPLNRWGGDIQKSRTEKKTIYEKAMKLGRTSKLVEGAVRPNPTGRNKRAVWIIPTQPFPEAHFAVYPEGLIEIPIKAGCPEFVCKKCGRARVKIYKFTGEYERCGGKDSITAKKIHKVSPTSTLLTGKRKINEELGYTDCGCNAGFEGGINLDPFMGAGTTALVALKQRKRFIGIEIKQEYIDMANKRIAKVQQEIF